MKLHYVFAIALVMAAVGWFAGTSVAEEKADDDDMMAKMAAAGMPGPMHKHMQFMVGEWTTDGTFSMPTGEVKSVGTSTVKWVNGGRYLDVAYHGPFAGMDYKGRGYMGHNNPKKQFEMVWLDNFGSGMDFKTGTCSADGKIITLNGTYNTMPTRQVYKAIDANSWSMSSYYTMGGKDHKEMEILYTRKAAK